MSIPGLLAESIFWLSGVVLFHTFLGYGAWMAVRAPWRARPLSRPPAGAPLPEVCAVVVAHNAGALIAARLADLLASDYPAEKLRVLLVSDGSTDDTVARAAALRDARVEILALPARQGKAAGLNAALLHVTSEIVVLTDARQQFAPDAIRRLAEHFADPEIGAVSGALEIATAASATGAGVDAYWRYEKFLRAAESRVDSCIGCTGAIYALRRALFTPIPADTLLDDVVIPMQIAAHGARVIHDPAALAFDPQPLEPASEQRRKERTLAGNFQMLFRHASWLLPWRHRLWWQLLSHKYLRLAAPLFLLTALAANLSLAARPFYQVTLAVQVLFYAAAALGRLPGARRLRVLALPAGFVFLNAMTLRGLHHYLTRRADTGWQQAQDAGDPRAPLTANTKPSDKPASAGAGHDQEERLTNNFDFIRFLLATLVMVSHSTQLIDGNSSRELLARSTPDGLSLGFVAVNYFFLISGFLIVRSWLFTHGLLHYLHKRILRIYPGFVVAVLVSVLVIGALGASSAPTYWQAMDGHYLWASCKRLITLRVPTTPPTFEGLPFPSVNGAIWTVRYEFCCYLLVAAMGFLGICKRRIAVLGLTLAALVTYAAQSNGFLTLSDTDLPVIGVISNWPRFATYFLAGMCFYLFRDLWRSSWKLVLGSALLVVLGCAFRGFSCVVLPLFGGYLLFYFAFLHAGALRRFGRRGDFSYGLFCYGWPVQSLILWIFHGKIHPVLFFALSFSLALALAVGSWYAVEKPFLRWKNWKPAAKPNGVPT